MRHRPHRARQNSWSENEKTGRSLLGWGKDTRGRTSGYGRGGQAVARRTYTNFSSGSYSTGFGFAASRFFTLSASGAESPLGRSGSSPASSISMWAVCSPRFRNNSPAMASCRPGSMVNFFVRPCRIFTPLPSVVQTAAVNADRTLRRWLMV